MQLLFRARVYREFTRISIAYTERQWCRRNNLQVRTALCVDYTNGGFSFLASPFPQLHAHMYFALVQLLFRAMVCMECMRISIADNLKRWCRRNNLQARSALCVDYSNRGFAFLASPFPQLHAHMQFALVQLMLRARICRDFTRISIVDSERRWCRRNNLQARTELCVDCTNGGFAFLASPFPQLHAYMYFALVQLLFRARVCREFTRIFIADTMRRWCRRNNLQARTALCVGCTSWVFAFLASPFPPLHAHM